MKDYAGDVRLFNETGGIHFEDATPEMVKMQCSLVLEECRELIKASADDNKVETLDGAVDLAYVLIGLGLMEYVLPGDSKAERRRTVNENVKCINGDVNIFSCMRCKYCSPLAYIASSVNSILVYAEEENYSTRAISCGDCCHIINYLMQLCHEIGADFNGAWDEVQRSNMSKFYKAEDGTLYAKHREDGKILKGPDYFRPNLAQFVRGEAE